MSFLKIGVFGQTLFRNKGYIGKVFVPAYKDEPAEWVDGSHKALIDEETFYDTCR